MSFEPHVPGPPPRGQWLALLLSLAGVVVAGGLGVIASLDAAPFYAMLRKPQWAPPAGVFAPVWTALYIMMAVAAWLAWRGRGSAVAAKRPLVLYAIQLVLNALWSWLFFRWHLGLAALVEIVVLWIVLRATLASFWRVNSAAGMLLLPCLLWIAFAAALTAVVWRLNPAVL